MEKNSGLQSVPGTVVEENLILDDYGVAVEQVAAGFDIVEEKELKKLADMPRPIFIATPEKRIVSQFFTMLKNNPLYSEQNYDIQVLDGATFQMYFSNYCFLRLDKELKERIIKLKTDVDYKSMTIANALQLKEQIKRYFKDWDDINFTESEFKSLLAKTGKNLSHTKVWEVIDIYLMFGLLSIHTNTPNNLPRHKLRYVLTITLEDQLAYAQLQKQSLQSEKEKIAIQLKLVDSTIKKLQKQAKKDAISKIDTNRIEKDESELIGAIGDSGNSEAK